MNIENGLFAWTIVTLGLWGMLKIYQVYSKIYHYDPEAAIFVVEDLLDTDGYGRSDDHDAIDTYEALRLLAALKATHGVRQKSVTSRRINKTIIMKFPKLAGHLEV